MDVDIGELLRLVAPVESVAAKRQRRLRSVAPVESVVAKRHRRCRPVVAAVAAPEDSLPSCADIFAFAKSEPKQKPTRCAAAYFMDLKNLDGVGLAMLCRNGLGG
jgi:hypothetical protein